MGTGDAGDSSQFLNAMLVNVASVQLNDNLQSCNQERQHQAPDRAKQWGGDAHYDKRGKDFPPHVPEVGVEGIGLV